MGEFGDFDANLGINWWLSKDNGCGGPH